LASEHALLMFQNKVMLAVTMAVREETTSALCCCRFAAHAKNLGYRCGLDCGWPDVSSKHAKH
jgi:hypothetical protein